MSARSVVHDAGGVFDRVREDANATHMAEAARLVRVIVRLLIDGVEKNEKKEGVINISLRCRRLFVKSSRAFLSISTSNRESTR